MSIVTGPANQRIGKAWMRRLLPYLQANGYPHVDLMNRKGVSDITGVGDLAIEATTAQWDKIGDKLDQAQRDARRRGLGDTGRVWKPRRAMTGGRSRPVGECFAIMTIDQDLAREKLIAALEQEVGFLRKENRRLSQEVPA